MPDQIEYNVWNKWDPLEVAMIGSCENKRFFENVKDIEIREKLTKLLIETQEDLDNFASVLEQHNVVVYRPEIDTNKRMWPKTNVSPSITHQPRDNGIVLGNNLLNTPEYPLLFPNVDMPKNDAWKDFNKITRMKIEPPCWTLVGDKLYVDISYQPTSIKKTRKRLQDWVDKHLPNTEVCTIKTYGHSDGVFHTCKPGVIISIEDPGYYDNTFPNWDVLHLPEQSFHIMADFGKAKEYTQGKYWLPGEENNKPLLEFINLWLNEWVGYAEETVFDVNILMINENTACVNNYNKQVFDYFKKHHIEPIIVPMRHRYFWDGGLHCCSLDLVRTGEQQNYV